MMICGIPPAVNCSMVAFLEQGAMRVSVVKVLTDNEKKIVDESAKQLFARKPEYVLRVATPTARNNVPNVCGITAGICDWSHTGLWLAASN